MPMIAGLRPGAPRRRRPVAAGRAARLHGARRIPTQWSSGRLNLANALQYLPSGHREDNLAEAVEIYEELLRTARPDGIRPATRACSPTRRTPSRTSASSTTPSEKYVEARLWFSRLGDADAVGVMDEQLAEIAAGAERGSGTRRRDERTMTDRSGRREARRRAADDFEARARRLDAAHAASSRSSERRARMRPMSSARRSTRTSAPCCDDRPPAARRRARSRAAVRARRGPRGLRRLRQGRHRASEPRDAGAAGPRRRAPLRPSHSGDVELVRSRTAWRTSG